MTIAAQTSTLKETLEAAANARRLTAYHQAVELQRLADYAHLTGDDEFAYLEVATHLHLSDRAAQHRLRFAQELTDRLPAPWKPCRTGRSRNTRPN